MPLAMFLGFNNQLQNVVFGHDLLRDEKAYTFEWLFRQFRAWSGGGARILLLSSLPVCLSITRALEKPLLNLNRIVGLFCILSLLLKWICSDY